MEKYQSSVSNKTKKQKFEKLAVSAELKISHYNFIQTVVLPRGRDAKLWKPDTFEKTSRRRGATISRSRRTKIARRREAA